MRDPMSFGPGAEMTLSDVIAHYESEGFGGQFASRSGACVQCLACDQQSEAGKVSLFALHRLEGASDPDDMMAAAALECPACGTRGTITLAYGPVAPPQDGELLKALMDMRGVTGIRPGM